ncbi:protein-methionine-sulfoxide reductase catalytic subunit MsrP [Bordetella avium]|uniref:Protein-methionine-sulfoxide reductase catalytic subunit MsrP n=1 Tax=Bordetella avium (strain 197N) TaxID=360910 RepID=Q2KUL4_BORA1|nr:protein-methionine-sulfoxide reductase catalytic subunit MsrP [Bordetella avium]AZY48607.1 protein-methionine-sulfoxide reductase catalytic subunit MsrP [Bordetella avium]AZY51987.1 protein-methionine-sulfoxide reductase catalytic subunit MsrP [Bordetella avium]RIQ13914.1 protein-methionine-sulfoxide reductase catalytic subunit MsrP [Bordetella avium]RIQ17011.1 protein-methionine-sulfoxide reductase catalytic subunit MsrP [Bordetella avium]RIQ36262.1 protein-methionine-sulfoxide reductase c
MLIRKNPVIPSSEITPEAVWRSRRDWMARSAALAATLGLSGWTQRVAWAQDDSLPGKVSPEFSVPDKQTSFKDVSTYNNYYEFGLGKADPARNAGALKTRPWTVSVEGEVGKPRTFDMDELLKLAPMEERVYRLRCVEGWSMVIPWTGYSLANLLKAVAPTGNAKFVEFTTVEQRDTMTGLNSGVLDWPYTEALRLDEAMHPLTMLVFGVYGKLLPNQNGAPLRLAVPWKYGFKSAKSLVRIRLLEQMPRSSWMKAAPQEYGFYANVNPQVPHPRWSQATERRIGEDGLFSPKRPTLMFNGYADQVAALYQGLDLRKNY